MNLAFCYISKYRNIQNQSFNLGSDYIYTAESNEQGNVIITREANTRYIADFYKDDTGNGFESITAIVGENGSGKSTLLQFLIEAFTEEDFMSIGRTETGIASFKKHEKEKTEQPVSYLLLFTDKNSIRLRSNNWNRVIVNIPNVKLSPVGINELPYNLIYYNPVYDFTKVKERSYAYYADVSSNKLIQTDLRGQDYIEGFTNKSIELHKYLNVYRQLKFTNQFIGVSSIDSFIPKTITVSFHPNRLPDIFDSNALRNIRGLEKFYNTLNDLWSQIVDGTSHSKDVVSAEYGTDSDEYRAVAERLAKTYAHYYLTAVLFIQLNRDNDLIDGYFNEIEINYATASLEELTESFIISQGIFGYEPIHLMGAIDDLINNAIEISDIKGMDVLRLKVEISDAQDLFTEYNKFINSLPNVRINQEAAYFIHFDWDYEISSGEKAFLDLFSRIHFAWSTIIGRTKKSINSKKRKIPAHTYLFIDEGELGFHLQWQKEFLSNLIQYIPQILFHEHGKQTNNQKLHLILTTHSPISLSDVAQYNVIYMQRGDNGCIVAEELSRPARSFGANIHDLLHDAFFLRNGFMGKFAHTKIDHIIKLLISDEPLSEVMQSTIPRVIDLIDEPIIKVKLRELYAQKAGLNFDIERINAQIDQLQKQRENIQRRSNNDNNN